MVGHIGFQKMRHFHDGDLFDYKFGVVHTRWGLDFGAEVAERAACATTNWPSFSTATATARR
ncbi:hypothetical protein LP420_07045 [Massilia sp. B-10]|nr:hypothetical protein LP420_07045 [Massilia sp. B-10]